MFSFTNKKVMGIWSSEVKCIKWMEKSEAIQKTLQWKYRLKNKLTLFLLLQTLKRGVASKDFAEKHSVPTFMFRHK